MISRLKSNGVKCEYVGCEKNNFNYKHLIKIQCRIGGLDCKKKDIDCYVNIWKKNLMMLGRFSKKSIKCFDLNPAAITETLIDIPLSISDYSHYIDKDAFNERLFYIDKTIEDTVLKNIHIVFDKHGFVPYNNLWVCDKCLHAHTHLDEMHKGLMHLIHIKDSSYVK
jgi:hypothetical protein